MSQRPFPQPDLPRPDLPKPDFPKPDRQQRTAHVNTTKIVIGHNTSVKFISTECEPIQEVAERPRLHFQAWQGRHLNVFLDGKQTVLPMSPGKLKNGLQSGIKKQLGLKGPKDEKPMP